MKQPKTPIGIALLSLAICLVVGVFVIAADQGVLQNPIRLSILIIVAISVPIANYYMAQLRQARSKG